MKSNVRSLRSKSRMIVLSSTLTSMMLLGGCNSTEVFSNGPVFTEDQLAVVPVGSSRDQVLLSLGTPSTTGTFENEVFYYISQKRQRRFAYQKLKLIDQQILAVYFDENEVVTQVADYRLQDGKVFDFISRTTPTGGKDQTFIQRLFTGSGKSGKPPPITPGGSSF